MSNNQRFAYSFGAAYLLVGLVGFGVTGGVDFAAPDGKDLLLFGLNPLHNVVHLAVGGLLVLGARAGASASRNVNVLVGAVYLVVGVVGLFLVGKDANIVALNHPDNALHLATALVALGIGLSERPAVA
jgi:hypothetical protein